MEFGQIHTDDFKKLHNPKIFGKHVLERIPYSAQELRLRCTFPRNIIVTGRGTGKTTVCIGDDATRKLTVQPLFDSWMYGLDYPLTAKVLIIGNVKETAKLSQDNIRHNFQTNEFLQTFKDKDQFTREHIATIHDSHCWIKTASNAARGIHADMKLDKATGEVVKGKIYIYVDELWFVSNSELMEAILEPMLMFGGPGSQINAYTTPYGQEGSAWDIYSGPATKPCPQKFIRNPITGQKTYLFDRNLCEKCKAEGGWRKFHIESYQNPYIDLKQELETKRRLEKTGRGIIWNQEHLGLPQVSVGLFFNGAHIRQMTSQDERMSLWTIEEMVMMEPKTGDWLIGVDNNSGIKSKKADYASVSLKERLPNGKVELRYVGRFRYGDLPKVSLKGFREIKNESYSATTLFVIELLRLILARCRGKRKVYVGFGYGQAIMTALENDYPNVFEYVTDSGKEIAQCFLHFRTMIELERFKCPFIGWLVEEMKYLTGIDENSEGDRLKIKKSKSWGSGKTVDGLFAIAYGMKGTMDQVVTLRSGYSKPRIKTPFQSPQIDFLKTSVDSIKYKKTSVSIF